MVHSAFCLLQPRGQTILYFMSRELLVVCHKTTCVVYAGGLVNDHCGLEGLQVLAAWACMHSPTHGFSGWTGCASEPNATQGRHGSMTSKVWADRKADPCDSRRNNIESKAWRLCTGEPQPQETSSSLGNDTEDTFLMSSTYACKGPDEQSTAQITGPDDQRQHNEFVKRGR